MSTPTVLPPDALAWLRPATTGGPARFLRAALARAALSLVPAAVAVAASAGPLPPGSAAGLATAAVAGWCAVSVWRVRAAGDRSERYPPAHPRRRRAVAVGLLVGLAQAGLVLAGWRVGQAVIPAGGVPPALVPVLAALPLAEVWLGWHTARLAGLGHHDDPDRYLRLARRLGWTTLLPLLPPLAAGAALAAVATRLPFGLSAHPDAPALVLALAGGVLLAGLATTGLLLVTRQRPVLAAAVTAGPVPAALLVHATVPGLAATSLTGWGQLLPAAVIALAGAYAVGLVLAAQVLFDSRSYR